MNNSKNKSAAVKSRHSGRVLGVLSALTVAIFGAAGTMCVKSVDGLRASADEPTAPAVVTHTECFGGADTHDGDGVTDLATALASSYTLASGNYYLSDDLTLTNKITVGGNTTVNICLNGHVLRAAADNRAIESNGGATLSLYDCNSADCTHFYTEKKEDYNAGIYVFDDSPDATTSDGSISGGVITGGIDNSRAGAIFVRGTFIMYGGTISGNTAYDSTANCNGGGVFANEGSRLYLRGGAMRGNYAKTRGGGVYVTATAYCEMEDGFSITHNTTTVHSGGGVFVNSNAEFHMNGGVVAYNTSANGGGISTEGGNIYLNGGKIEYNTVTTGGGGVYLSGGALELKAGCSIENNAASTGGGAQIAYGKFTLDGGSIDSNEAQSGGGVQVNGGMFELKSGSVSNNSTTENHGGGIFVNNGGSIDLSGGSISDNTSQKSGGGIYATAGCQSVTIGGTVDIAGNTAWTLSGGGIFVHQNATVEFTGGTIRNNTANRDGGGVFVNTELGYNGKFVMSGGSITGNSATRGGGVYLCPDALGAGEFEMTGGVIQNNTAVARLEISSEDHTTTYIVNSYGGGVYADGTFKISGAVDISGNKLYKAAPASDGTLDETSAVSSDVYLAYDKKINVTGKLANDDDSVKAHILIEAATDGEFTVGYSQNNTAEPREYFVSQNSPKYLVVKKPGEEEGTFEAAFGVCAHTGTTVDEGTDDPTCEEDGAEHHSCSYCEAEWDVIIDKLNHNFATYVPDNNATCTTNATESATCSRCDKTDTREIADTATGHKYTQYANDNNATCQQNATETARCDHGCGTTDTREVADSKAAHSYGAYTVTLEPTFEETGEETAICSVCGDVHVRTVPVKTETTEKEPDAADDNNKSTSWWWLYLLLAILAVLIICIIIFIIARKKKKERSE